MNFKQLEARISARSYAIWEREGRQQGRDAEYWARAKWEIEQEILVAALEGNDPQLVPELRVSRRPIRRDGQAKAA